MPRYITTSTASINDIYEGLTCTVQEVFTLSVVIINLLLLYREKFVLGPPIRTEYVTWRDNQKVRIGQEKVLLHN
jgi:hypothetical protein